MFWISRRIYSAKTLSPPEKRCCLSTKLKFGAETRKSLTARFKSRPGGIQGRASDINPGLSRRIYSEATEVGSHHGIYSAATGVAFHFKCRRVPVLGGDGISFYEHSLFVEVSYISFPRKSAGSLTSANSGV